MLLCIFFWLSNNPLFLFPLQFLTSWAPHRTTVDTIYDVVRVAAISMAAHRLAVLRIDLMVPESSLARDWCRICQAMWTISSKVIFSLCLMFFCLCLNVITNCFWRQTQGADLRGHQVPHWCTSGTQILSCWGRI